LNKQSSPIQQSLEKKKRGSMLIGWHNWTSQGKNLEEYFGRQTWFGIEQNLSW
jgi:hypothetical protein